MTMPHELPRIAPEELSVERDLEVRRAKMPVLVSIGILAWNEEKAIGTTLHSLLQQTLLAELEKRGAGCEIICVINGCTDRTPDIAAQIFTEQSINHPCHRCYSGRVENLPEQGKQNAWNQFVHRCSSREAQYLIIMDADIVIHRKEALWNMIVALENDPELSVTATIPCKDIAFKRRRAVNEKLSMAMSQMTRAADGQLCAQLYCIRAAIARKLYLPRDLGACEDGFIKAVACTDFFTHELLPKRIRIVPGAEHTFEAYTSPSAILRNQKRQIIGQTILHVLLDDHFKKLTMQERVELGETLKRKEEADRFWIKRLIAEHLKRTRFFWQLYPSLLTVRWKRLKNLSAWKQMICLPAAAGSVLVAFVASFMAWKTLKKGGTEYWPKKGGKSFSNPQNLASEINASAIIAERIAQHRTG
jgi:glycosyltransferase involved in cell wall biosynthesis